MADVKTELKEDDKPWYVDVGDWLVNTGSNFYQQYLDGEKAQNDSELNAQIQQSQAAQAAQMNQYLLLGGAALLATLLVIALKK